uniref:Uncharacterized protein n=1 Tax=Pristionchus pacificus TaxID=54126 RepID=A0A2A6BIT1_PRIPA|eukprot:PDM65738.1 hypothetical protein PRIPAC_45652 [Pristionchus pacificus]
MGTVATVFLKATVSHHRLFLALREVSSHPDLKGYGLAHERTQTGFRSDDVDRNHSVVTTPSKRPQPY